MTINPAEGVLEPKQTLALAIKPRITGAAVSGSGPACVFALVETQSQGDEAPALPSDLAARLARGAV